MGEQLAGAVTRGAIARLGLLVPAGQHEQFRKVDRSVGECRIEHQCLLVAALRFDVPAARTENGPEVVLGGRGFRQETRHAAEHRGGLVHPRVSVQEAAEVFLRLHEFGIERDGLAEARLRPRLLSRGLQREAEAVICRVGGRMQADGGLEPVGRTRQVALCQRDQSGEVERIEIVRQDGKNAVVLRDRVVQAPGAMVLDRVLEPRRGIGGVGLPALHGRSTGLVWCREGKSNPHDIAIGGF